MSEFVASNGVTVRPDDGGITYRLQYGMDVFVGPSGLAALREFFLAERDAELGRWRSKEHPEYVVYKVGDWLRWIEESTGRQDAYLEGHSQLNPKGTLLAVIREYQAAHPEPKPWHDAKPGEVWLLTIDGADAALLVDPSQFTDGNLGWDFDDPSITAGRRIWPEED